MGNFARGARTTAAPPAAVWELLVDVGNWPQTFTPHLSAAHLAGPLEPGTVGWVRTRVPPVRSSFVISSVTPGRQWSWRGKVLWLTMNFDHRCEPTDVGCRITFDVDLDGFLAGIVRVLAGRSYRPKMERALDLLVEQAESRSGQGSTSEVREP